MSTFDVEVWINTVGTEPEMRAWKKVEALDHDAAARAAKRLVRLENPEINAAKIDTWFTKMNLT